MWPWGAALGGYLALTCAFAAPIFRYLTTAVPAEDRDPLFMAWSLWWNAHRVPLSPGWWTGLLFYPVNGSIAFSEHMLGLGFLATPILRLGDSPVLAYNTLFLLSFPLTALAAHALVHSLTGRHDAALVGGLAFGF